MVKPPVENIENVASKYLARLGFKMKIVSKSVNCCCCQISGQLSHLLLSIRFFVPRIQLIFQWSVDQWKSQHVRCWPLSVTSSHWKTAFKKQNLWVSTSRWSGLSLILVCTVGSVDGCNGLRPSMPAQRNSIGFSTDSNDLQKPRGITATVNFSL